MRIQTLALYTCACLSVATLSQEVLANERHFTYNYETAVLPENAAELEVWTTWRTGRENYYSRFDHRFEFEVGLTSRLMTAFYLNFTGVTAENDYGKVDSSFEYKGVSSEWKYKLLDAFTDPLGMGLYGEISASPTEYEIEAKLLFDKKFGDFMAVANLVGEVEWELESGEEELEWEKELIFAPSIGITYFANNRITAGLELRNHNEIVEGELEHSVLHGGPVLGYVGDGWWAALTFLPQITSLKGHTGDSNLVLDEHEKLETRLLFANHF